MNKTMILIAVVFGAAIVLPSCKKDWTCVCTDSNGQESSYTINDSRKPEADLACKAFGFSEECELR